MVYTLQHGVQKTWSDYTGQTVRYGGTVLGVLLVAFVVGNIWYAMRYQPASPNHGNQPNPGAIVSLAGSTTPDTGVASTAAVQPTAASTNLQGTSYHAVANPISSLLTAPADTATGGLGAGPTDGSTGSDSGSNPPVTTTPTDPTDPTGGTTTGGTGGGTTTGGGDNTGSGDGTVTVPPVTVDPPVLPLTLTTPPINL